jgi:hypothetical protein
MSNRRTVYEREGYDSREEYLKVLSEEYNLPLEVVTKLADQVGKSKEFTDLIVALQDLKDGDG